MIDFKMFLQHTMVDFTWQIILTQWRKIETYYIFQFLFNLSRVREFQVKLPQKQEIQVKNIPTDNHLELLHQLFCK